MHRSARQEEFSLAYVQSVAAAAGIGTTVHIHPDVDGIDVEFRAYAGKRARLEAQVKSYVFEPAPDDEHIAYPLKVENYELLRIKTYTPRILILVTLPEDVAAWTSHTEQALSLRRCGYFLHVGGWPESDNKSTKTVAVPRANLLSPSSLADLMARIEGEEWPP